ncbi:hypothetical protein OIU79_003792 [Salix purpurea]|uniref:Uncharacterized protein n=1 Tax=Salix purpurea TaxID=77065 RepID=A0A9Q0Z8V8_SALPP|nr:hypothetical protein OIU79_003792 [Salix purpurea]
MHKHEHRIWKSTEGTVISNKKNGAAIFRRFPYRKCKICLQN